jgi:hypothetical protein
MVNILGVNCSVREGLGRLTVVMLVDGNLITKIYKSPSVYSFTDNIGEILNWHKDNVLSLISMYNIEAIVVKKTERSSFVGKPKKSDCFKLYLEGVMLSLAGTLGIQNRHLEKSNIKGLLGSTITEKSLDEITDDFGFELDQNPSAADRDVLTDTLIAVLAYKTTLEE